MRLANLELKPEGTASAGCAVVCVVTGAQLSWNAASKAGWVADLDGKAFVDYYSPKGLAIKYGVTIEVRDIRFAHQLSGGGDPWRICGRVFGHPRFDEGHDYCPSVPVAFDEQALVVTSASGKKYHIASFATDKDAFINELKKTIERGYYEVH